jgi:hypothetical protein
MKCSIFLSIGLSMIAYSGMSQTLQTVTNTTNGNTSTNVIRLTGELKPGVSGSPELVLAGPLNTAIANDTRCFIAWKNSGLTYAGGAGGSAGTLLLQSRTDAGCPQCGIDMVTRDDIGTTGAPRLRMRVTGAGNVGIGVDAPTVRLDVNGNSNFTGNTTVTGNSTVSGVGTFNDKLSVKGCINMQYSSTYAQPTGGYSWINYYAGNAELPNGTNFSGTYYNVSSGYLTTKSYHVYNHYKGNMVFEKLDANGLNPVTQMYIQGGTGFVGIGLATSVVPQAKLHVQGTSYFTDNMVVGASLPTPFSVGGVNAKLSVKGIIVAEKLKVTLTGWPDYVFDDSYQLPSLETVEAYIKTNKHLANVPSAEEVEKNGLDVGDNNAALLRKVEELTLYLIEQNKKLKEQNDKLAEQNKRIAELGKKVKK